MKYSTFLHVAREGWWLLIPILTIGIGGSVLVQMSWPAAAAAVLAGGAALRFRDAERRVPPSPLGIVAPVDGRIVHRRECHDPYLNRAAIRIGIEVDPWGVYYLRAPVEGALNELKDCRQCHQVDQASWIITDEGDDIVIVVMQGGMFGQRPCTAGFGQRVGQGRRCGARRLARRIDLFVPPGCRMEVQLGDRIRAGTDLLATMVHNAS